MLRAVQDDAQSFAADIRDTLQFAKHKLDHAEKMMDFVDQALGGKSNTHWVKTQAKRGCVQDDAAVWRQPQCQVY